MELLAIFCGLQICISFDISNLIVENNSLLAIRAVLKGEDSCILQSDVIREILWMSRLFHSCCFQYVSRLGNDVAHKLPRYPWQVEDLCTLWDSISKFFPSPL